jgi:hypothetical protein
MRPGLSALFTTGSNHVLPGAHVLYSSSAASFEEHQQLREVGEAGPEGEPAAVGAAGVSA